MELEIKGLKKDSEKNANKIHYLAERLDSLINLRAKEKQTLIAKYKNSLIKSNHKLSNIFEFGYASFLIDATNKITLIDEYSPKQKLVTTKWDEISCSVKSEYIAVKFPEITFNLTQVSYHENNERIVRTFNDLGRIYFSDVKDETIRAGITIIADNSYGLIFIVGFLDRTKYSNNNKGMMAFQNFPFYSATV